MLKAVIFSIKLKKELAKHIKDFDSMFFALTKTKCVQLVFKLVRKNILKRPCTWINSNIPGVDWFERFK